MNLKSRYILKCLAFRALPFFLPFVAEAVALIWVVALYGSFPELVIAVTLSAIVLPAFCVYYVYNVVNFLRMIKHQETKYKIKFSDKNPKTVAKFSLWVICTDEWLISPGKFAICRQEIKNIARGESYLAYKAGVIYPVKIKTHSGKTIKLKLSDEAHAKAVRNWARR